MVRYINTINEHGTETIEALTTANFENKLQFRKELKRLLTEYRIAGFTVWSSQRACKDWKEQPIPEKLIADLK